MILIILIYYQLLRDAQAQRDDERKASEAWYRQAMEWETWYVKTKKPEVEQLKSTIAYLNLEKVNRTPDNNNNNNSNSYIIIILTI